MPDSLNATRLQVIWNRLLAIVEEQGQALIRAAFSPIVRECGDISAGLFDAQGRMLAQAVTGTPGHINTMAAAVQALRAHFPTQSLQPGDIVMTNDPWLASGHLNDFLLMMPAFHHGRIIGYSACTSHLVDLGGKGMGPLGEDIFDEGLLLPPCKLVEAGAVNQLLLDIVKANGREPIANAGDIYALIAACEAGATRLAAMLAEFKLPDLTAIGEHIIQTSKAGTLDAIAHLPNGTYSHAMTIDGYDQPLTLQAALTIHDDGVAVDFTGTSPCSRYGINVPLNYATAYSVFALRCIIGPDIPNNAGSLEPFTVDGPKGCILNAQHPSPVAMRHTIGQMTPDLMFGCLVQACPDLVPAEGAATMYDLPLRSAPEVAQAGKATFAIELTHNGGTGARPTKDGLSATAFPSGVWGSQVEMTETVAPVLIKRRELIQDSGGAGQFRGGLGQRIELQARDDHPMTLFLSVDRTMYPAQGRFGGHPGAVGSARIGNGAKLPSKGEFTIAGGETLYFATPGGGGYGNPAERDDEKIKADVLDGTISAAAARDLYGWNGSDD